MFVSVTKDSTVERPSSMRSAVCTITADNCGIWKHLAEFFTALFVLVNDLNTDLQIRKGFGKIIGNCAAANDQSIFDLMCLQPNLFKEKSCIFGCCDNRDKIAIVNQMITARDA